MTYPNTPGHKGPAETSRAAADAIKPKAATVRQRVLWEIGIGARTADEVAAMVGLSILAVRPRCSELARLGLIADTGMRRPNESGRMAVVWRLA